MSGAGKWIKKHPMESIGLLAASVAIPQMIPAALGSGAAATGAAAGSGLLAEGLGAGAAGEMLSAVPATMGDKFATMLGNATLGGGDKYMKLAEMGMGMMDQPQQPMQAPQLRGPQGPGQQLQPPPMYGDPELEKRRQYDQWLAQQGGGIYV